MAATSVVKAPAKSSLALFTESCDLCSRETLPDQPELVWREFGNAKFSYRRCGACCGEYFTYLDIASACVKRAERHNRAWGKAVERLILDVIEAKFDDGSLQLVPIEASRASRGAGVPA